MLGKLWDRWDKYIKTTHKEIHFVDMDWINVLGSYLGGSFSINGVKELGYSTSELVTSTFINGGTR
jgi:hypothetical protein